MRTQFVLSMAIRIVGIPLALLRVVSHLVLGILQAFTFGLLMLALSLTYVVVFLGPLLGLSWVWLRVPALRLPIALVGVPWALVGNAFVVLVPVVPDEADSGTTKVLLTALWPYSFSYWQWDIGSLRVDDPSARELEFLLERETRRDPVQREYVARGLGKRRPAAPSQTEPTSDGEDGEQAEPTVEVAELLRSFYAAAERQEGPQLQASEAATTDSEAGPFVLKMPSMGRADSGGTIEQWLVSPGQTIAKYELLVRVRWEDLVTEIPSPVSGLLLKIVAEPGAVASGDPIAIIDPDVR